MSLVPAESAGPIPTGPQPSLPWPGGGWLPALQENSFQMSSPYQPRFFQYCWLHSSRRRRGWNEDTHTEGQGRCQFGKDSNHDWSDYDWVVNTAF